jgi:hypothetical protein
MKKSISALIFCILITITSLMCACGSVKGKYYVESQYIIATASLTSTVGNASTGEIDYYGIDISYDSDIKLNSLSYKCDLYSDGKIIETFEGEVTLNGLYSKYIPLKTKNEYEHAKVVCTGWSDENPTNFVRLNAKSSAEILKCGHKNLIDAKVESIKTNSKKDYLIINYKSNTAYNNFRFYYDNYVSISVEKIKVCVDCGYYEI